jgi:hypothetical protein
MTPDQRKMYESTDDDPGPKEDEDGEEEVEQLPLLDLPKSEHP